MNCQEFQEILPHIIDEGGSSESEAHLRSCRACAELAQDLKHISDQARLMLPMHDPSPRVWNNIQQSLVREGLIREGRFSRTGQPASFPPQSRGWTPLGAIMAVAAVLILAVVVVRYQPTTALTGSASQPADQSDAQMMSQVAQRDPAVRRAFEDSLKQVNSYIADAEKAVNEDQADADAQEHLRDAHEQKAMLYEMANGRAGE